MADKKVTICACSSRSFVGRRKVAEVAAALTASGFETDVVPDLCRVVMHKGGDIGEINKGVVLACYPRAVQNLFDWREHKSDEIVDIRNNDSQEILSRFGIAVAPPEAEHYLAPYLGQINDFPVESGTDAWFPVIDKKRCIECGKCHDFCLFGVYAIDNKQVKVVNPQNCKNNCPACARMCPSKAIIFPKYEKSPINGGTSEEEVFNPEEMDRLYRERLKMRLQQRRAGVSLLSEDK